MTLAFRLLRGLSAAVLFMSLFVAFPVMAQEESPVVATVNGEPITEADLALAAQDFEQTLMQLPPEQRMAALINGIIDIRLMARAASAEGLDKQPDAARRLGFIADRALRAEYLRAHVFDSVSDEEVKALYDKQVAAFEPAEEIRASHILVETEEKAKELIAELDSGADFAELAKANSTDAGSGANGGDLDFFGRGRMVPVFEEAAFALEPGTYTKTPVQSEFGWHIILVTDKRMSSPPTLEQLTPTLREEAAKQKFIAALDRLRAEATIEIVAPEAPAEPPAPDAPPADAPAAEPAAPQ
jgi:peptidyl-prolyl cis-trans isomerase C